MAETLHRVLRLLSLLETRPTWSAPDLAQHLGVSERTIRRDVERLRELGYPVDADRGQAGGYRLGRGRRLPPLVLDDDEAVALVACLRMGAQQGQDSIGEAALRALVKIDRVLPARLRPVVQALDAATVSLPGSRPDVDWTRLSTLAFAQAEHRLVRFAYTRPDGTATDREVEPARLAIRGHLWYLQGFDRGRDDWRVFRLDRMSHLQPTTWTFTPRPAPPLLAAQPLAERWACVGTVWWGCEAQAACARIPEAYRDDVLPQLADSELPAGCTMRVGAPDWHDLAWHLLGAAHDLDAELRVLDPQPLVDAMHAVGARAARAGDARV